MLLGMSFAMFTAVHVAISLVGIAAGLVAVGAMLAGQWLGGWTGVFLIFTALTSLTGYVFPASAVTPAHIVGALTLVAVVVAGFALYARRLEGGWRNVYVAAALASLYFNCFVGLVQTFQKQPALVELAPTQSELPFAIAQGAMLLSFVAVGVMVARRFRRFHPLA